MSFKTLRDFNLAGKTVLLRADLNVPAKDGKVTDTTRIDRLKPTIDYLSSHGARTVIMSHFGRPKGQKDISLSLKFLTGALKKSWGQTVQFADDCIGDTATKAQSGMKNGDILLLENVRFYDGEEKNDPDFSKKLAANGDLYINDAFSAAHRAHASTEGIAHLLPAGAGLLMETELNALHKALEKPQRPVAAIVGGAKISTKLELLGNLVQKVDILVLGGGMANTFLFAQGTDIKKSLCETDMAAQAREIMDKATKAGCKIILPHDVVIATDLKDNVDTKTCTTSALPDDYMALDIGPDSIDHLKKELADCKTIVWNGPLGAFEIKPFDSSTNALAQFVAEQSRKGLMTSIAGGGDTVAALENAGAATAFSYTSTAGGAFLEWLEGKTLPGVAALIKAATRSP